MSSIRVYAHHDSSDRLRWCTLIQVGDDWTIRGTVYMKNPGSSRPIDYDISDVLDELNRIDDTAEWYAFSVDQTMNAIVSLFRQRAEKKGETFTGIIQILNLINTMSPDLAKGVNLFKSCDNPMKSTVKTDIDNIVLPLYVGWGDFGKVDCVYDLACQVIDAAEKFVDISYLREAKYPHPLYLMRYGANKPVCVRVKEKFYGQ